MTAAIDRTRTSTWAVWVLSILPLAGLAWLALLSLAPAILGGPPDSLLDVVLLVFGLPLLGPAILVAQGVCGIADQRMLERRGIRGPFPWGFALLGVVYLIGRATVLRARVGGGLAPAVVACSLLGAGLLASVLAAIAIVVLLGAVVLGL